MTLELLGLLSRIRLGKSESSLQRAAELQFLFPLIGAFVGLLVAIVASLLFMFVADAVGSLTIGVVTCLLLYFITGIIHIEGLADFGDGLMASGDAERKRSAMKDVSLGAGGTFLMILDIAMLISLISQLDGVKSVSIPWFWGTELPSVLGIVVAEAAGKLAMITAMRIGPSSHEGMGSVFVSTATNLRYMIGLVIAIAIGIIAVGPYGLIILAGVVSGIVIAIIARKNFGGVGGDSFGASNEIGRLMALLIWVILP
ncbi:MAG: adenosylcobinamide-GDP ribazoletransferase [Thermoplasmata archaeon]